VGLEVNAAMTAHPLSVEVLADPAAVARQAAVWFLREADEAVRRQGRFTVALSGGSTPRALYELLAGPEAPALGPPVAWDRVHLFWGDERYVPPDHPDSNYRMTREALLTRVPVPPGQVHRIATEHPDPERAAAAYEATLRSAFGVTEGWPRFDLVLLGLGPDAHTASLFPGTAALHEATRLVAANWVPKFKAYRITLTYPVFNHAACVLFLVGGAEKTDALREVWHGPRDLDRYPAQGIQPTGGRLVWLVDRPAVNGVPLPEGA
jgi:6-phosphogluconolactonase